MIKFCPECSGDKFKVIDSTHWECRYCGKVIALDEYPEENSSSVTTGIPSGEPTIMAAEQPSIPAAPVQPDSVQPSMQQNVLYTIDGKPRVVHPVYVQPSQAGMVFTPEEEEEEMPTTVMLGVAFFIPIVGFILSFTKRSEYPLSAKAYLMYASVSTTLSFIVGIVIKRMLLQ